MSGLGPSEQSRPDVERLAVTAAHDLRTPLGGIAGFAALLSTALADQPTSLAMVEQISGGARSALSLVDDLLSYVTACAGPAPWVRIDLTALVEQVVAELPDAAEVVVATPLGDVLGDERLLRLLFRHLLANAATYVEEGTVPHLEVTARAQGAGRREVLVADNARGIEVQDRERVFEAFERGSTTYTMEGTGLGLAICTEVVRRHDGRLGVTPRPGGGSTFAFTLPEASAEGDHAPR